MMLNRKAAAALRFVGGIALLIVALLSAGRAAAQDTPLIVNVTGGQFEPLPVAVTPFEAGSPELAVVGGDMVGVVEADLQRSGLFKLLPRAAFIAQPTNFDTVPVFADWRAINADALVTGRIEQADDGRLIVQFRVFDTGA